MKINDKFEVTVWSMLALIGVVGTFVASGTWLIAKTVESNELEGYRRAKDWKASEAIAAITELSKTAKLDASEQSELLRLRSSSAESENLVTQLTAEAKKLQAERDSLRDSLASVVRAIDTVDLPVGEARFLVSKTVAVGVVSIYKSRSSCEVRVGDKNRTIEVGEALSFPFGGQEYSLTLLKLSDKSCTFSFAQKSRK